jgi:hypothetical protein
MPMVRRAMRGRGTDLLGGLFPAGGLGRMVRTGASVGARKQFEPERDGSGAVVAKPGTRTTDVRLHAPDTRTD